MLDYGALPPEINSARIYSGPGSGPLLAAATAWDALAAELFTTAAGYGSVVAELTDGWLGPASWSMAEAVAPYVAWLHVTATAAEQTAAAAKAAAAAYELAFAMTVPPPVVAANRSLLLALIATNFLGQNTPAIAAAEAHYAQMWLQDATAMYGYAASSATATQLAPFTEPRQQQAGPTTSTSSPTVVDYLEHVPNVANSVLSSSNAVTTGRGIAIANARLAFQQAGDLEATGTFGGRLVSTASVRIGGSAGSAGMGRATLVGPLSVPSSWAAATPGIRPVALTLPSSSASVAAAAGPDMPPIPGSAFSQSVLGTLSRHGFDEPRPKSKPVIVRSPAVG